MAEQPDHFVVYADLLGFRDLVLTHRTVQAETLGFRQNPRNMAASLEYGNPLQRRLKTFHTAIHNAVTDIQWQDEVSVMIFSDSLFLATRDAATCMSFCHLLMVDSISLSVPVRMGVGHGTFVSNTFAFESTPRVKAVTTQFLGTGVVHASDAEHAVKGLRIAVHPSCVEALTKALESRRLLSLPEEERTDAAHHEWNFIPLGAEWQRWGRRETLSKDALPRVVKSMKAESPKEPDVQIHYDRTLRAIGNMTDQMHNDWLRDPRRRR